MVSKKASSGNSSKNSPASSDNEQDETRRDFMVLAASATAAVGGAACVLPLVGSMNPADDVIAAGAPVEIDISDIEPGESITTIWRGKNIFIRRRTEKEIKDAKSVDISELPDPQSDSDRIKKGKEEWLILVGVCTHLGCVPITGTGDYGGWFCPCHGSHYDTSGRIRKGPAPTNLVVPKYTFLNDSTIRIG